jgi:hypothetical protein
MRSSGPLAQVSLWGDDGTSHPATAKFSHILDHMMALVSVVIPTDSRGIMFVTIIFRQSWFV